MQFRKIWTDPVFSGTLAAILAGIIPLFLPLLTGEQNNEAATLAVLKFLSTKGTANWIAISLTSLIFGLITFLFVKINIGTVDRVNLSSNDWFELISENLENCGSARIYLRKFDHPDDFQQEHRDALMRIITTIKEKISNGNDIKIISFNESNNRTGFDWIKAQLPESILLDKKVKIIQQQPSANSSSLYLFDNRLTIFNKRSNKKTRYYYEDLSNSITFEFMCGGFDKHWKK